MTEKPNPGSDYTIVIDIHIARVLGGTFVLCIFIVIAIFGYFWDSRVQKFKDMDAEIATLDQKIDDKTINFIEKLEAVTGRISRLEGKDEAEKQ